VTAVYGKINSHWAIGRELREPRSLHTAHGGMLASAGPQDDDDHISTRVLHGLKSGGKKTISSWFSRKLPSKTLIYRKETLPKTSSTSSKSLFWLHNYYLYCISNFKKAGKLAISPIIMHDISGMRNNAVYLIHIEMRSEVLV
jgi:hypothetical protein